MPSMMWPVVVGVDAAGGHDLGVRFSRLMAADPLRQSRHAFPASGWVDEHGVAGDAALIRRRCAQRGGGADVVFTRARETRSGEPWMLLWANLDVAAVDREREAVGGMVVTERLRLRERADAEERP